MKNLESKVKATATQLERLDEREIKFFEKLRAMEMNTQSSSHKRKRKRKREEEDEEEEEGEPSKQNPKRNIPCPHCSRMFPAKRYVTIHVNAKHANKHGK